MTPERYNEVVKGDSTLTVEEVNQGWHFCPDFDGLLVGPDMPEQHNCTCPPIDEPKTLGDAVLAAVAFTGAIQEVIESGNSRIFVWRVNAQEQIEAWFQDHGWEVKKV